jgi:hypothetical protein
MAAHGKSRRDTAGIVCVAAAAHADDQVLDQLLGVQGLPGGEGRAGSLALAALDAGIERQQLVPAEVSRPLMRPAS